jgi:hypothetical protein
VFTSSVVPCNEPGMSQVTVWQLMIFNSKHQPWREKVTNIIQCTKKIYGLCAGQRDYGSTKTKQNL